MGLKSAFTSLFAGRPAEAFDYLFISQDQVDATQQEAANLEARIQDQYRRGLVSYDEEQQTLSEIQQNAYPNSFDSNADGVTIGDSFVSGLNDGIANEQAFVQKATSGFFKTTLGFIPWQVWVILLVIGAIYAWPIIIGARARLAGK